MAHVIVPKAIDLGERVALMQHDARFDMDDCDVPGEQAASIRREVRGPEALPKVPKVFLSNDCVFNCAYCGCRQSNEVKRCYASTPRELAELSYRQARHGRHGVFLTSAILGSADYTEELIIRTMQILRGELCYRGYIHAKVMPGTDPALIRKAGFLANRLSVNIEVARSEGYARVAHNKNKRNILTPMGQISAMIAEAKECTGFYKPRFATTQTTQLMAGTTGEDDYTILNLSGALYRRYNLSRVYYTAFHYEHPARGYEQLPVIQTPKWRMGRLYQADRLMQQYGFSAEEIAPEGARFLSPQLDPKAAWALRNLRLFPVEVNRADYETLLRVPGIGVTFARRILQARRQGVVTHDVLRALGVWEKKSRHFITCNGRYAGDTCEDAERLLALLAEPGEQTRLADPRDATVCG